MMNNTLESGDEPVTLGQWLRTYAGLAQLDRDKPNSMTKSQLPKPGSS